MIYYRMISEKNWTKCMKETLDFSNNRYNLNESLAISQGLCQENFDKLILLYDDLKDIIKKIESESETEIIKKLVVQIIELEYTIQETWKFERNADMHYFTFIPRTCKCPKLDNMDYRGTPYRLYNTDCPIHG